MRLVLKASLALLVVAVGVGCEPEESLPQKPQLRVDRLELDFTQDGTVGTYIGSAPQESLIISNQGLENLKISNVVKTGDTVFEMEGPLKTELKGKETTYLRVLFKPTQAKSYSGAITIEANHEVVTDGNGVTWSNPLQINIRGKGVAVPDGGI